MTARWCIGDEARVLSRDLNATVIWVGICNALMKCACGAEFEVPLNDLAPAGVREGESDE